MTQTDKYKLNLLETSDPFSPEPLNENMEAVETQLARVEAETKTALDAKAAQTALAALEAGQLRFKCDSYTGDGTSGKENPTRLEFDFKPLLLIVVSSGSSLYGGHPWVRGMTRGRSVQLETGTIRTVTLTWEDRAVQWVNYLASDSPEYRLNTSGYTYRYIAIGISE